MATVAQVIQGEAGNDPAAQFAVASTIFNRMKDGNFPGGSSPTAIVNAPQQFTGVSSNPNSSAQQFASAIEDGTLPQFGNTGNAVNFGSNQAGNNFATRHGLTSGANIGGNFFSDNLGPPSSNFVAPSYGSTSGVSSSGSPNMSIDAPSDFTDPGTTLGNASGAVTTDSGTPADAGSGTVVDPNTGIATLAAGPGNTGGGGVYNPAALENAGKAPAVKNSSAIPDVADAIKIGFGSIGDNIAASVSKAITSSEAYLQRFGVMILAIVLFIVAAWFMIPRETKDRIVQTAGTAAKAAA